MGFDVSVITMIVVIISAHAHAPFVIDDLRMLHILFVRNVTTLYEPEMIVTRHSVNEWRAFVMRCK